VQRSTDAGKTWTDVADGESALPTANLAGLTNGTTYVFRVAARTIAGLSAWSNVSNAVMPLAFAASPRNVLATPGDGLAVVTWLAPVTLGGSAVTDYRVQRSTDGGKTWTDVADGVSTVTKAVVTELTNGTTYVFRVAAVTAAGVGAWSTASVAVVPRGAATAPLNLQATRGDRQVVLKWNSPASTGGTTLRDYLVQRSTDGGTTWATVADGVSAATGATVAGLVNGTSYVFRVAAVTDFATGAYTAPTPAVMPVAAPGAITGLSVQGGTSEFVLNWTAPGNNGGRPVTDYTIEYRSTETSFWTPWDHAASAATSATIPGLAANAGYLFRVRAVTDFTSGPAVETTEALVLLPPPTSVVGRAGIGSVAFTWLPPRVTGGMQIVDYRVQYSTDGVNWTTASDGVSSAARTTVRGLARGTSYVFRVAAVTAKGVGSYSAVTARLAVR
jgi:titin